MDRLFISPLKFSVGPHCGQKEQFLERYIYSMKILFLGDIVGTSTLSLLEDELFDLREELGVDFVIANGENVSNIHGISAADYERLVYAGIDFITTGNHVWGKYDIKNVLDDRDNIIRPMNYPARLPGTGARIYTVNGINVLVMNVSGTAFMDALDNPFDAVEDALIDFDGEYDLSILDIHAEATAEKLAIANYFDGKIDIIVGTHTHVQTADERILPNGTAYITDLGMCGPMDSIIGVKIENVIKRQRDRMPSRFEVATGRIELRGAIFDVEVGCSVCKVRFVKRFKREY